MVYETQWIAFHKSSFVGQALLGLPGPVLKHLMCFNTYELRTYEGWNLSRKHIVLTGEKRPSVLRRQTMTAEGKELHIYDDL